MIHHSSPFQKTSSNPTSLDHHPDMIHYTATPQRRHRLPPPAREFTAVSSSTARPSQNKQTAQKQSREHHKRDARHPEECLHASISPFSATAHRREDSQPSTGPKQPADVGWTQHGGGDGDRGERQA